MTRGGRAVIAAAVVAVATLATAGPAMALQTGRLRLTTPSGADTLLVTAGAGHVQRSVLVSNLTGAPLPVTLDVVSASRTSAGHFDLGVTGAGLAGKIKLSDQHLVLRAHETRQVDVRLDTPRQVGAPEFAAVAAAEDVSGAQGLAVRIRLAVPIGVVPGPAGSAVAQEASGSGGHGSALQMGLTGLGALLVGAVSVLLLTRRRRGRPAATVVASADPAGPASPGQTSVEETDPVTVPPGVPAPRTEPARHAPRRDPAPSPTASARAAVPVPRTASERLRALATAREAPVPDAVDRLRMRPGRPPER